VWRRVGSRAYVIGFTCYEGRMGIGDPKNNHGSFLGAVEKDQDPSIELEELLNAAPRGPAFASLQPDPVFAMLRLARPTVRRSNGVAKAGGRANS